ncbi:hypothetical protein BU25DRAFT_462025 [Macroventuria anomochaeta]|uniref:Uncharacterized protein n=1 Tax=Macroventuria anomochaeta TaxID=301207 RepID=A0ACB6RPR4_9PLEO|nr:uncharacterized protein BU25DRAFT_462025 [Macroventuria anomochaeta]KAF2623380.1 hypothetical protein BU25DRAFT_462025 [Macroventuria anomochaeta]
MTTAPTPAGINSNPSLYDNVGCVPNDAIFAAGFDYVVFNNDGMADTVCSTACVNRAYFAIAYGRDCLCSGTAPIATSDQFACTFPNAGARLEIRGSNTAMSVFSNAPAQVILSGPGGSTAPAIGNYLGCWAATNSAGLPSFASDIDPVTANTTTQGTCQIQCATYKYFAIGNGNTGNCDSKVAFADFQEGSQYTLDNDQCDLRAAGNPLEAGGAQNALSVFSNPAFLVHPDFLTLCSKLCSANVETYNPE